jgi:hypothetical protein
MESTTKLMNMSTAQIAGNPVENTENELTSITIDTFTRSFVEQLDPKVRMVDSDDKLSLFCYTNCSDEDPDYVKACRGLVYDGEKLLLKAYSYTPEYTHDDPSLPGLLDIGTSRFFDSHEGAVVRMFHYDNKWYVSTHRRLDAFRSKWASKSSFGAMFVDALEYEYQTNEVFKNRVGVTENVLQSYQDTLDKDSQYMFLVRNIEDNRIVCHAPDHPSVLFVGTFRNGVLDLDDDVSLPTPKEHRFITFREVALYLENVDITKLQGLCVFASDGSQYKLYNRYYGDLYKARGNEPSIKYRYLQVRLDKLMLDDLKTLYPSHVPTFDKYENAIYEIAMNIKSSYVKRFIKKEFVTVPPEEYSIMKQCHQWHISDRDHNHISFTKVMSIVNEQSPSKLNKMIRRHLSEEKSRQEKEVASEPQIQ